MTNLRASAQHRFVVLKLLVVLLVVLALLASTGIIYLTGGTEGRFSALTHLYYIPILASALSLGPVAGVLAALAAAVLGGPMMPANVALHVMQPAGDWLTRALLFILVGMAMGGLTARWRAALQSERRQREQLSQFGHETLAAFTEAIAQRDLYTGGHVNRIAGYATTLARHLDLSPEEVERIRCAAHLHDVGKLAVPTGILRKPGSLNRQEWDMIEQHPVIGAQIVERVSVLQDVAPLVRHHHERYDGTGYPAGLRGDQILLGARIIAVVDAFDAMISDRPYRCAMSIREALEELTTEAGMQFDPEVVNIFLKLVIAEGNEMSRDPVAAFSPTTWAGNSSVSDVVNDNGQRHMDIE